MFAPLERLEGPASPEPLRIRGGSLGVLGVSPTNSGGVDTSVATVTLAMSPGLQATELATAPAD